MFENFEKVLIGILKYCFVYSLKIKMCLFVLSLDWVINNIFLEDLYLNVYL